MKWNGRRAAGEAASGKISIPRVHRCRNRVVRSISCSNERRRWRLPVGEPFFTDSVRPYLDVVLHGTHARNLARGLNSVACRGFVAGTAAEGYHTVVG